MRYTYHYLSGSPTASDPRKARATGYSYRLRRSDGKLVRVSDRRLKELREEGRLSFKHETPLA